MPLRAPRRLSLGLTLTLALLVGCSVSPSSQIEDTTMVAGGVAAVTYHYHEGNFGRVVGTLVASPAIFKWAGVTTLEGAEVQAFDSDGRALGNKVKVDAAGHFVIEGLGESRPRIFIEATLNGLRYSATMGAPRDHRDYPVLLDPSTTYLADKLRRSALDHDVAFDRLDEAVVDQTEEAVNTYMTDDDREDVLRQTNADLNAYAFDHFMDRHPAVKLAVNTLSPAILRGWEPPYPSPYGSQLVSPSPTEMPTPSPKASATDDQH